MQFIALQRHLITSINIAKITQRLNKNVSINVAMVRRISLEFASTQKDCFQNA